MTNKWPNHNNLCWPVVVCYFFFGFVRYTCWPVVIRVTPWQSYSFAASQISTTMRIEVHALHQKLISILAHVSLGDLNLALTSHISQALILIK